MMDFALVVACAGTTAVFIGSFAVAWVVGCYVGDLVKWLWRYTLPTPPSKESE